MAYENRERNAWAVSLLKVQEADRVLEIGFGPGWAIERVAALASAGFVAGVEHSQTMVHLQGLDRFGRILMEPIALLAWTLALRQAASARLIVHQSDLAAERRNRSGPPGMMLRPGSTRWAMTSMSAWWILEQRPKPWS